MNKLSFTCRLARAAWLGLAIAAGWGAVGSAQTLPQITERGTIRIGFIPDQPPFASASAGGAPIGYALDLCAVVVRELEQRAEKLTTSYVAVDPAEGLKAIAD